MKFADSGDVYHFTIIGNYDFKPIGYRGGRANPASLGKAADVKLSAFSPAYENTSTPY